MTKDRLNELKAAQNDESATLLADSNNDGHLKIEIASKISKYKVSKSDKEDKQNNIKGNKELNNVYEKVKQVKEWIEQIEDDTVILKKIQSDILQSVFNTSNRAKLDEKMDTIKTTSKKARAGLKELFNIKSSLEHKDGSSHRLVLKILSTQHPLLQKQYINAVTEYQDALVTHKQKTEQLIRDQLQIVISSIKRGTIKCVPVDSDLTNEEFEKILGNQDVSVFVGDYIKETMETRQKLNDARLRHKELLQLEMSIMELHEMLIEMATLVENQGETIDRIENYVSGGVELVENGKLELMKARENKDKARKKKIYLITCLITVLLLLIIIVVADFYFSRST